ncbi:MAG: aminoacyl-tRNA hydrolase [Phycisphaerales bacterium]|nr:aminoacyl-tRNA hydrolase [Phycisphaerales bacterium]
MKLIVGLGNPGRSYADTRHNVGFRVTEELARRWGLALTQRKFNGLTADGRLGEQRVLLLKPTTYMNLSGRSISEAFVFYKLTERDLLIVADDLALPIGRLRIRARGSAGGHKGLASTISALGNDEFARLRVGIGSAAQGGTVDHVLGPFTPTEEKIIGPSILRAADAVECWLNNGVDAAMNQFNRPDEANEP